jgi:uncharacterized ion transporter superfamily protein YfcC
MCEARRWRIDKLREMKNQLKNPHVKVILFLIIIVATVATHAVPAGQFDPELDPETGRTLVAPGIHHQVEPSPAGFFNILVLQLIFVFIAMATGLNPF